MTKPPARPLPAEETRQEGARSPNGRLIANRTVHSEQKSSPGYRGEAQPHPACTAGPTDPRAQPHPACTARPMHRPQERHEGGAGSQALQCSNATQGTRGTVSRHRNASVI